MIVVYVLRGLQSRKRYVGITDSLPRRLAEHRKPSSIVARLIGQFEVLRTEEFKSYALARVREKYLKSGKGREWLDQVCAENRS